MEKSDNYGWIYTLSNDSFHSGIYKIGMTTHAILQKRVSELDTTGVPGKFHPEFAKWVKNPLEKEKKIHKILKKYRIRDNREFFKIDLEKIRELFDLIDGDWYKDIQLNIDEFVKKVFDKGTFYGIVVKTRIIQNKNGEDEEVCCIVYEDGDKEDLNCNEFEEIRCTSDSIPKKRRNQVLNILSS